MKTLLLLAAGLLSVAAATRPVEAHCDSMDGPVVLAARSALASGNVSEALVWVKPAHDQAVRDAFAKTLVVRKLGKEAQDMADMYFFETLVRLHREGEGEPYTGLKPAGFYSKEKIFAVADHALQAGQMGELSMLATEAADKLSALHKEAHEAMHYSKADVAAGRDFVKKYTAFMHYIENLHKLVQEAAGSHATRP